MWQCLAGTALLHELMFPCDVHECAYMCVLKLQDGESSAVRLRLGTQCGTHCSETAPHGQHDEDSSIASMDPRGA